MPPPSIFHMVSASLPKGLGQHLQDGAIPSVIIIDQGVGAVGLRRLLETARPHRRTHHCAVILLAAFEPQTVAAMRALFGTVATAAEFHFLPVVDLISALKSQTPMDLTVGVSFSQGTGLLTLLTGDLEQLVVPAAVISKCPTKDLQAAMPTDGGQTLTLGGSGKVAFAALRLDHDPAYRRAVRQLARAEDQSFGGCLRRAREHRGLGQGDLGTSDRSIRNIENGTTEGNAIRAGTRKKIEKALRMTFSQIAAF